MYSMTGYGKGEAQDGALKLKIEFKSVNGKFLEINSRLPKVFAPAEDALKKQIAAHVKRGTVEVWITYEDESNSAPDLKLNLQAAESFLAAGKEIAEKLKIKNDITASYLLRMPEVLRSASGTDEDKLTALVSAAAEEGLNNLDEMRAREGGNLKLELERIGKKLSGLRDKIEALEPECIGAMRDKLHARIQEALAKAGAAVDESRFVNEVAYLADKADITEETARLKSHINQYFKILDEPEAGRKLEFLTQELGREINTITSKSQDLRITNTALEAKNEIEKIKEQIRNVE